MLRFFRTTQQKHCKCQKKRQRQASLCGGNIGMSTMQLLFSTLCRPSTHTPHKHKHITYVCMCSYTYKIFVSGSQAVQCCAWQCASPFCNQQNYAHAPCNWRSIPNFCEISQSVWFSKHAMLLDAVRASVLMVLLTTSYFLSGMSHTVARRVNIILPHWTPRARCWQQPTL